MPKTRIKIYPDGRVEIEGIDYQGDHCLRDLSKIVAELRKLGVDVEILSQVLKPEARLKVDQKVQTEVRIGES